MSLRRTFGSHLQTQKAVPRTISDPKNQNAQKCHVSGCSRDFGTFGMSTVNEHGLLPNEEIKEDTFDEIWGKLGTKFKSKFLAMMPVTP